MTASKTLKAMLAKASPADRAALAALLSLRKQARQYRTIARTKQLPPWDRAAKTQQTYTDPVTGESLPIRIDVKLGGRGSGKTQSGAWVFAEEILWWGGKDAAGKTREWGIVAPSFGAAWSVCVEGPSGIVDVLGEHVERTVYSQQKVVLKNGAVIWVTGADDGAPRIQGKNLSGVWCDEIGLWFTKRWKKAWIEGIYPALRKAPAIAVMTGTPKQGHPLIKWLIDQPGARVVVMPTRENAANLDPLALRAMETELGGSRLGRQELNGEFLTDIPGALFTLSNLDDYRVDQVDLEILREIIIGWDPATTAKSDSDEHGIVAMGRTHGPVPELFVLEDASGHYSVEEATRKVAAVASRWNATGAVVEVNNGGDWIPSLARQVVPELVLKTVTATHGKARRLDKVVAVSEQGRLHLVGDQIVNRDTGQTHFAKLIDQATSWVEESNISPDRLDALGWAATYHLNAAAATSGGGFFIATAKLGA